MGGIALALVHLIPWDVFDLVILVVDQCTGIYEMEISKRGTQDYQAPRTELQHARHCRAQLTIRELLIQK